MAKLKGFSQVDLQLWAAFTSQIKLLPGRKRLKLAPPVEVAPVVVEPQVAELGALPLKGGAKGGARAGGIAGPVLVNSQPGGLDKATWGQFYSGRMRAARRLDLHGMTAMRAHHAVIGFLERARQEQLRCVEIITGNGDILARELPHWLHHPAIRPHVLAVAHPNRANTGALRILLRRAREPNGVRVA